MEEKKYISSVKLADNSVYNIKDLEARELLRLLFEEEIIISGGNAPIDAD